VNSDAIKVLVFREGERWIAQCLEVNFAVSAEERDELLPRLRAQLRGQMVADRRRGVDPLSRFKRAPERFWRMFEAAEPWRDEPLPEPLEARVRGWIARAPSRLPRHLVLASQTT
jgi:hypothetical protein